MPSLEDQLIDISAKIKHARETGDLTALSVLEPQMELLLEQRYPSKVGG
ncbi:hypothetical protein HJ581_0008225 [Rhodococcus opacus]|jgi:hypothetical protein|nr:hypothetical protein HJ581_0008225 [Rhodococcus opacus]